MKTKILAVFASAIGALALAAENLNPVMWADVPDISICRKGDTYYMTSTSMHFNPGIPVMASKDLVNWKIVSYCYDTIENRDQDNLENGKDDYGFGTWASTIRYNGDDGYFYVTSFNNKVDATYLFRTKDVEGGKWECHRLPKRMYDHSFWIENGQYWFVNSNHPAIKLWKVKSDFSGFEGEGKTIIKSAADCVPTQKGLAEGSQLFKRGDYYYLFNICWPAGHSRLVAVHRAKSLEGPWEGKCVYECEGIAQGGMIDTPDGKWYSYLFGDRGGVGRIPYMIPIAWKDDWPVYPDNSRLEIPGVVRDEIPGCCASDEFDGEKLDLVWQFNHNPDPAHWSVTERPGFFRITTSRIDSDMLRAKNTLTQRTFGPVCEGVTKLDYSSLKQGDVAGLALFQALYGFIGVEITERGAEVVLWQNNVGERDRQSPNQIYAAKRKGNAARRRYSILLPETDRKCIYLRAVCDFTPWKNPSYTGIPASEDACRFFWSLDGNKWEAMGEAMYLPYTIGHFTGYRFALFAYSTKEAGGKADFDYFHVSKDVGASERLVSDGTNPIIKTTFTPDPAGYVDGEYFYLFTGHDEPTARGYKMFDWQVFRTKDMKEWENLGRVLNCGKVFPWARGDGAWASQAIKREVEVVTIDESKNRKVEKCTKWYWYVAVFRKGGQSCIAVATADRVEGPWTDAIGKPLVEGRGYIDPSVFVDDDGQAWLFWGNCGGDPGCWYAPLKENMVELAGEVKPVPGLMDESAFGKPLKKKYGAGAGKPIDTNFEEAPWIYKHDGKYYLEYAAGGVPENWSYSWADSIHGPWHFGGKVMENAGGTGTIHGGSVFFNGEWYMVYHNAIWMPGGADCRRSACIERYTRNADGSIPFIVPAKDGVSK